MEFDEVVPPEVPSKPSDDSEPAPPLKEQEGKREVFVALKGLVVRETCEMESNRVGEIDAGTALLVIDRAILGADGTRRACVALESTGEPRGWVTETFLSTRVGMAVDSLMAVSQAATAAASPDPQPEEGTAD